jgi:hypothetical protein
MHHHMQEQLCPQIKFVSLEYFPTYTLGQTTVMESHRIQTQHRTDWIG